MRGIILIDKKSSEIWAKHCNVCWNIIFPFDMKEMQENHNGVYCVQTNYSCVMKVIMQGTRPIKLTNISRHQLVQHSLVTVHRKDCDCKVRLAAGGGDLLERLDGTGVT